MAQKKRLLLIEDEEDIRSMIKIQADISSQYKLLWEEDGLNGYRAVDRERPDLVILDLMLPGLNGLDVCRKMKQHPELKSIPIIILSAKNEEVDMMLGLELGADDYVAKPFSPKVLFSRIKAILRRGGSKETEKGSKTMSFGDFTLEVDRHLMRKKNKYIQLTLSEFGILKRLLVNRGQVLSRDNLLDDVQNEDHYILDRNIDVHIASLRKKLGPQDPRESPFTWIETVRGVGYRLKEEETATK